MMLPQKNLLLVRSSSFQSTPEHSMTPPMANAKLIQRIADMRSRRKKYAMTAVATGSASVMSAAFDAGGRWLASGSDDKTVKLWEPGSGKLVRTLEGHQNSVTSVAFDPTGRYLASGSEDGTIRLWNPETGACLAILYALPEGWVAFRPDGHYRFSGNLQGNFWHAIGLARFEPGELDEFYPHLRLPDDTPLIP